MKQALSQATRGRMHILELMKRELDAPRELSKRAPRIFHHRISTEKIGAVIGPGGKVIRGLCDRFGVSIDVDDDGVVTIKGDLSENAEQALEEIKMLTSEIEKGKVYKGRVVSITPYGAFIECLPGKEALLHISRIARERINQVSDVLSEGDTIEVKCTDIDEKGRAVLSRKELL
jgi:polyribonucleotide nucleotidyltransferase